MSNKKILNRVVSSTLSIFIALVVAFSFTNNKVNAYIIGDQFNLIYNNVVKTAVSGDNGYIGNANIFYSDGNIGYGNIANGFTVNNVTKIEQRFSFCVDNMTNGSYFLFRFYAPDNFPPTLYNISYSYDQNNWIGELGHEIDGKYNGYYSFFTPNWASGTTCWVRFEFSEPTNYNYLFKCSTMTFFYSDFATYDTLQSFLQSVISSKISYIKNNNSNTDLTQVLNYLQGTYNLFLTSNENTTYIRNKTDLFAQQLEAIAVSVGETNLTYMPALLNAVQTINTMLSDKLTSINTHLDNIDTTTNNKLIEINHNFSLLLSQLSDVQNDMSDYTEQIIQELRDISQQMNNISINVSGGNVTINQITNNYNSIVNNYSNVNNYLATKLEPLTNLNTNITNGNYNLPDNLMNVIGIPINFINKIYNDNSKIQILFWLPLLLLLIYLIIGRKKND